MTVRRALVVSLCAAAAVSAAAVAEAKLTVLASGGSGAGQLQKPSDVAIDGAGNVIVAEAGNARGQKFSPAGASLLTFGGFGSSDDQLGDGSHPDLSVAVGANGDYYVGSGATGSVHRYRPDGSFVSRWSDPGFSGVQGIAALANGDIYVLSGQQVVRFDPSGVRRGGWPLTYPSGAPATGLDLAGVGDRLYVLLSPAEGEPKAIVGYDGAGVEVARWTKQEEGLPARGGLDRVEGIGTDPKGNVYAVGVGSAAATILKFDGAGNHLGTWPPPLRDGWGPANSPCGLYRNVNWDGLPPDGVDVAGDAQGNVWIVDAMNRLQRLDLAPHVVLDWGPDRGSITGIAVGTVMTLDASGSYGAFEPVARYEWDFDGDGVFELDTGTVGTATHRYDSPGSFDATVRASSAGGPQSTARHRFSIVPWAPSVQTSPSLTGRPAVISAFASLACSPVERYEWDLDGDGTFERDTGSANSATTSYATPGPVRVGVRMTREGGHVAEGYGRHDVYPAPPPGPVGISINGGATYTNSRTVRIDTVWPAFTGSVLIANDGGLQAGTKVVPAPSIPWRLPAAGATRLPLSVYVRFTDNPFTRGTPTPDTTYQDDIILDRTRPVVARVEVVGGASAAVARHRLRVRARDSISGVGHMQVTAKKARPGRWRKFARRVTVRTAAKIVFVRVRDRAGNVSRWRSAEL